MSNECTIKVECVLELAITRLDSPMTPQTFYTTFTKIIQ